VKELSIKNQVAVQGEGGFRRSGSTTKEVACTFMA
jgi:hypothetical protein